MIIKESKTKKGEKIILSEDTHNLFIKQMKSMEIFKKINSAKKDAFSEIKRCLENLNDEVDDIIKDENPDQETILRLRKFLSNDSDEKDLPKEIQVMRSVDKDQNDEILKAVNEVKDIISKKVEEKSSNLIKIHLSKSGDLYRNSKEQFCYRMVLGGRRIKVLEMLSHKYIKTESILYKLKEKNAKNLYNSINEFNKKALKDLNLTEKIIESKRFLGFRINPIYNIIKEKK